MTPYARLWDLAFCRDSAAQPFRPLAALFLFNALFLFPEQRR